MAQALAAGATGLGLVMCLSVLPRLRSSLQQELVQLLCRGAPRLQRGIQDSGDKLSTNGPMMVGLK